MQHNILQMKKIVCLLFLLPLFAMAQKVLTHTVGPKESLSSIGRLYNINGRELAEFNKLDYNKGLTLGQVLKIPATTVTPDAAKQPVSVKIDLPAKAEPLLKNIGVPAKNAKPLYHTVVKKETLYAISMKHNKVPIDDIRKWNNLKGDALNEGTKLIVGYSGTAVAEQSKTANVNIPAQKEIKEEKIEVIQPTAPPVKKAEPVAVTTGKATNFNGGVFKKDFEMQAKEKTSAFETGEGGIFKSTSGWQDGKYYCLHNTAAPGTILKITNSATGKSVYAKVLDLIPDIKQNTGLLVRLSNAAADALGSAENKFICTINYSK